MYEQWMCFSAENFNYLSHLHMFTFMNFFTVCALTGKILMKVVPIWINNVRFHFMVCPKILNLDMKNYQADPNSRP